MWFDHGFTAGVVHGVVVVLKMGVVGWVMPRSLGGVKFTTPQIGSALQINAHNSRRCTEKAWVERLMGGGEIRNTTQEI